MSVLPPVRGGSMFNGLRILIVEDEAIVALALVEAIEEKEGRAVGPVDTVERALSMLDDLPIGAAILDANLRDRDVTPLALALIDRAVPFLIHSGTGLPAALARDHPDLPVVIKPADLETVLGTLLQQLAPNSGV